MFSESKLDCNRNRSETKRIGPTGTNLIHFFGPFVRINSVGEWPHPQEEETYFEDEDCIRGALAGGLRHYMRPN